MRSLPKPFENRFEFRVLHKVHKFVRIVFEIMDKLVLGILIGIAGILEAFTTHPFS